MRKLDISRITVTVSLVAVYFVFCMFFTTTLAQQQSFPPEIRVGFTYARRGANQVARWGLEIWAKQVNDTGGILLNGTAHYIKLIHYNDDEDCENVKILYERLLFVDKVHAFMHPGAGSCREVALLAMQYHIPTLNARSAFVAYSWRAHNWTWTLFPPSDGVTEACNAVLNASRALERPIRVHCNETSGLVVTQKADERRYNITYIEETLLDSSTINGGSNPELERDYARTRNSYVAGLVRKWKKLNPSAVVWSGCGSFRFMDALRRTLWTPPAIYSYGATALNAFREQAGWQAEGLLSVSANDYSENFTDPVWGDTQKYVNMYRAMFNSTPDTLAMTISTIGLILSESIKRAQSLDGWDIRAQIEKYNETVMYGPVAFRDYLMARPDPCYQHRAGNILVPVWPSSYPGYQQMPYPYMLEYPAEFRKMVTKDRKRTLKIALITVGCVLFLAVVVAGTVIYVLHKRWHVIFVPKASDNAEWGDPQ